MQYTSSPQDTDNAVATSNGGIFCLGLLAEQVFNVFLLPVSSSLIEPFRRPLPFVPETSTNFTNYVVKFIYNYLVLIL
jgi:hypothetical protein